MKTTILLVIALFVSLNIQGQVDTLVIGNKFYPLNTIESAFVMTNALICLPTEYESFNKRVQIPYAKQDSCDYFYTRDDEGATTHYRRRIQNDFDPNRSIYCHSFIDTIRIDVSGFYNLNLFIKSNQGSVHFSATTIYKLFDGVMTKYRFENFNVSDFFECFSTYYYLKQEELESTSFIVDGLYYRKGLATYFLDRQFLVIIAF